MKKTAFYFTLFPIFIFAFSNISSNIEPVNKRFMAYGDFLYWKIEKDGLDYMDDRLPNANNNGLSGDIKRAAYAWQSGFRIGFLSELPGVWIKREKRLDIKILDYANNIQVIKPAWHFKKVGLKTGVDFDRMLKYGFNCSGKSCLADIYGNYDTWTQAYDLPANAFYENSRLDDFRVIPNLRFLLGPSWEKCRGDFNFKIYLNFETNVRLNLSQTNRSLYQGAASNPQSRFAKNNLRMYGQTLYASLNF